MSARRPEGLLRTALGQIPFQAVLRGGEAAMPLLVAAWFGRSAATDLYALLAATFAFTVSFLTGAFTDSAVVPVLVELTEYAPDGVAEVAGSLLGHTLLVGAAGALVTVLAGFGLGAIASGPSPLLALLLPLMGAQLVATATRASYAGILNARGRYTAPPAASGAGTMIALAVMGLARHEGVWVIPLALFAGELVAIASMARAVRRELGQGVTPHLGRPEPVRRIGRLVRFEALGSLITRINPVLDQLMSRMAGVVGGGTLLVFAASVASLPTSVLQATLFPAFLTRLSGEAGTKAAFRQTTRKTLTAVTALLAASVLPLTLFRLPLCRALFLHGAMEDAGVQTIAGILPWALAGVPAFGALLLLARAHVALQNSRIMPSMGVLNAALNAALNLVLVRWMGLAGIAASTSLTYVIVAIVFWVRLERRLAEDRAPDAVPARLPVPVDE